MSMWKAALLGAMIPAALVLPATAQDDAARGPQMVFEAFDIDGDGTVTLEEMADARGVRFAEADANGDGVLDRDELLAAASGRMERGVDRMIQRLDADGDGAVSLEEMAEARSGRRGPGPEAMFERFDADGDGAISAAEFEQAIEAFRQRRGGHGGPGHRG